MYTFHVLQHSRVLTRGLCLFRASGDMKGGIVVEMKSGEKGNEESGLLNKPDQVRRHRRSTVYSRVTVTVKCLTRSF